MITKKLLEKYFKVFPWDDKFLLYHLTESGDRQAIKYICCVDNKNFQLNGYSIPKDVDELIIQVEEFISKLPYNSEYYCHS